MACYGPGGPRRLLILRGNPPPKKPPGLYFVPLPPAPTLFFDRSPIPTEKRA